MILTIFQETVRPGIGTISLQDLPTFLLNMARSRIGWWEGKRLIQMQESGAVCCPLKEH